jgi:hypothetical protein
MVQGDNPALYTKLQLGIDTFLDATEGRTAEDLLPWHVGSLSCASMTGLLIGEQLLHGYDIAQTLVAEWPIEAEPPGWSLRHAYLSCPASSTVWLPRASLPATSSP